MGTWARRAEWTMVIPGILQRKQMKSLPAYTGVVYLPCYLAKDMTHGAEPPFAKRGATRSYPSSLL